MITFYPTLRQHMKEKGITNKELAAIAGMNRFALCLTLWGMREWKLTEAVKICSFFRTPDAQKLFYKNILNHNNWKVK